MRNFILLGLICFLLTLTMSAQQSKSVTVPFTFDHNRIFVQLEFVKPDGTIRKANAFVDTGNHLFAFGQALAQDVGLKEGSPLPRVRLGGLALSTAGAVPQLLDRKIYLYGENNVETNLPASIMRHYVLVIDYANHKLTLAEPGALKPEGTKIPCRVNPTTGLVSVDMAVEGQSYPVTIDIGSAYTWLSDKIVNPLLATHSDWSHGVGAVGDANMNGMGGEQALGLARFPKMSIGPLEFRNIGAGSAMQALFDWYSKKAPEPVVGFIGPNIVKSFKLTIDYPNSTTYWVRQSEPNPHDLDQVGLTITPQPDGSYTVLGITRVGDKAVVENIEKGDRILKIHGVKVDGKTMGAVLTMLHGSPGETRQILLERAGKQFIVTTKVIRF